MEIFLSHNYKDKPIVEPIAVRLKEVFGYSSIFYDSWSIRPGDGIIDKMNDGLEKAEFFFFFISKNSLSSEMVKLEWQNALMRKTQNGKMRFIPIRIDYSVIPAILNQTLYIDFYTNGFEVGIKQIFDVLNNDSNNINYTEFENLTAYRQICGNDRLCERLTICTNFFMEPTPDFIVGINTSINNLLIESSNCISDGFFMAEKPTQPIPTMPEFIALRICINRPITKENPFIFDIKTKQKFKNNLIICVMHRKGPKVITPIRLLENPNITN